MCIRDSFWGHEAQIGYFPQDVGATIEHGLTVAEWLHRWNPAAHVEDIRGILGQMLFSGEEGDKQTKALSGGEQARLASVSYTHLDVYKRQGAAFVVNHVVMAIFG